MINTQQSSKFHSLFVKPAYLASRFALLMLPFFLLAKVPVLAATIHVNVNEDGTENTDQTCTIREAITSIKNGADGIEGCVNTGAAYGSNDTIVLAANSNHTLIAGANEDANVSGDLDIHDLNNAINLTIEGNNATIDAIQKDRVFDIGPNANGGHTVVFKNLNITGGQTPLGSNGGGIYIASGANVTFENTNINGNIALNNNNNNGNGGGVYATSPQSLIFDNTIVTNNGAERNGGGIYFDTVNPATQLTMINTNVSNNHAQNNVQGASAIGGGIFATSGPLVQSISITIADSVIMSNTAKTFAGGVINNSAFINLNINNTLISNNTSGLAGGGIVNSGTLTTTDLTLVENTSVDGGGFYNLGFATVTNAKIVGNSSTGFGRGAGIYNGNDLSNLEINSSTISNNFTQNSAGGIYVKTGTVTAQNTTISGNIANNGAAIMQDEGSLTLRSSTVSNNTAKINTGGISIAGQNPQFIVKNTIFSNNRALQQASGFDCQKDLAGALITSEGNNLIHAPGNCVDAFKEVLNDQVGAEALLTPLGNWGGPTPTQVPLPDSKAIDQGACDAQITTDQRGQTRPNNGCDIGAVEVQSAIESNAFTVNTFADKVDADVANNDICQTNTPNECSLRAAVQQANANKLKPGGALDYRTIHLGPGTYTFTLAGDENAAAQGDLDIQSPIMIIGAGADQTIIDANLLDRVFELSGGASLLLKDLTIRNGYSAANAVADGGAIAATEGSTVVLQGVQVEYNTAYDLLFDIVGHGGGIFAQDSSVYVFGSTLHSNTGYDGGAITVGSSLLVLNNSTVAFNHAVEAGGAVYVSTPIGDNIPTELIFSTMVGNTAGQGVGGVALWAKGERLTLIGNTIGENTTNGNNTNCYIQLNPGVANAHSNVIGSSALQCDLPNNNNAEETPVIGLATTGANYGGQQLVLAQLFDVFDMNNNPINYVIDQVTDANILANYCPTTDQRGILREQPANCDRGAVEFIGTLTTTVAGNPDNVDINEFFTYTITVQADSVAGNTQMVITKPDNTVAQYIGIEPSNGCQDQGDTITCAIGHLAANTPKVYTVTAKALKPGDAHLFVDASAGGLKVWTVTDATDFVAINNIVADVAELAVSEPNITEVTKDTPTNLSFTITNNGALGAVAATFELPDFTNATITSSNVDCSPFNVKPVICSLPNIAANGGSTVVTYSVTATGMVNEKMVLNYAAKEAAILHAAGDFSATIVAAPVNPDPVVELVVTPSTLGPVFESTLTNLTFTINNTGGANAIAVSFEIADLTNAIVDTNANCNLVANPIVCTLAGIASGDSTQIHFALQPTAVAGQEVSLSYAVKEANMTEDSGLLSATILAVVANPAVALEITPSALAEVIKNGNNALSFTVANTGLANVENVTVEFSNIANATLTNTDGNCASFGADQVVCTVGALNSGANTSINFTVVATGALGQQVSLNYAVKESGAVYDSGQLSALIVDQAANNPDDPNNPDNPNQGQTANLSVSATVAATEISLTEAASTNVLALTISNTGTAGATITALHFIVDNTSLVTDKTIPLKLYRDDNGNGTREPEETTLIASVNTTPAEEFVVSFTTPEQVAAGANVTYIVELDFAAITSLASLNTLGSFALNLPLMFGMFGFGLLNRNKRRTSYVVLMMFAIVTSAAGCGGNKKTDLISGSYQATLTQISANNADNTPANVSGLPIVGSSITIE